MSTTISENSAEDSQKIRKELPHKPVIPQLGSDPKKLKTLFSRGIPHSMVTAASLIHNSQKEMQPGHLKCGINTLNPKEAEKSVICNEMDKPRAYYPK